MRIGEKRSRYRIKTLGTKCPDCLKPRARNQYNDRRCESCRIALMEHDWRILTGIAKILSWETVLCA